MCGIIVMGLLYELALWSMCVCVWGGGGVGLWIQWFRHQDAAIPNG
jgi:hypothetical protein